MEWFLQNHMNVMIYYVICNIFTLFDLHKFGIQNAEHYRKRLYSMKYWNESNI